MISTALHRLDACAFSKSPKGIGFLVSLALYAGIHPVVQGFHKLLSDTFPYAIYYKIIDKEAVVFRVLDCCLDPIKTRRRLKKR
jgi:hypothetical protein